MANRKIKAELEVGGKDSTGPALRSVAARMGQVERQMNRFNKTAGDFNRKVAGIERQTTGMRRALATSGDVIASLAPQATIAAGFYLAGRAATYAVKSAATFEEQLFGIQKKSGATAEQMKKIGEEIKSLATEIPVPMSEIASAFERGAAAGVPLDELRDFAKLSASVADSWDTSAERVGNTFAGFTVGLGIARKDLLAYASLINDLADSGIADETGIADFIDRAGASLKNFGMTPEEIAAYGAALLNLKMPAEVGARAMDTITGKLAAPENLSAKSRTALEKIVGDLNAFSKLAGNQKMLFFLGKLEKMTGQQRTSLLGALLGEGFDDETARLAAGLDEVKRNLDMVQKHLKNPSNSVIDAQTKKLDLFNSKLEIAQGHLQRISTNVGEKILPILGSALDGVNKQFSDLEAQGKATDGMSPQELGQQREWFDNQLRALYPNDISARKFNGMYTDALRQVGRGEIKDVYDYIQRLQDIENRLKNPPRESVGRPGSKEKPLGLMNSPEFPGGGHGYSTNNLPSAGPVPADRNAPDRGKLKELADQYTMYRPATFAPEEVEKIRALFEGMNQQNSKNSDPLALSQADVDRAVQSTYGITKEQFKSAMAINLSSGESYAKRSASDLRGALADGGKDAGEEIKSAAQSIREAGATIASSIRDALSAFQTSVQGARNAGNAMGGLAGRGGVNADTGRTMPDDVYTPGGSRR
jgi:TP901 family phage tail tape measure protein